MKTVTMMTGALISMALLMDCSNRVGQSLVQVEKELRRQLQVPLLAGDMTVRRTDRQLTVVLTERLLFDAGSDEITPGGIDVLKQMGTVFKTAPLREIRVTGHAGSPSTIDRSKQLFVKLASSKARASHVVRVLKESGVDPRMLFIEWYGNTRPIVNNQTEEGRQTNRRLEIVLHVRPPLPGPTLVLSGDGS